VEQWERDLLTNIDLKVDKILEDMPHFVTWAKLGGAVATIATLTIALVKVL